jgi:hypothetical protein
MQPTPTTPPMQSTSPLPQDAPFQAIPMAIQPGQNPTQQPPVMYYYPTPVYHSQPTLGATYATSIVPNKKNFGTMGNFVGSLFLGFFFPVTSILVTFASDTTMMARFGVLLGTFNAFFWTGAYLYALWVTIAVWFEARGLEAFMISGVILVVISICK